MLKYTSLSQSVGVNISDSNIKLMTYSFSYLYSRINFHIVRKYLLSFAIN